MKLAAPLKIQSTTTTQDIFIVHWISIRIVKFYAEGRRLAHGTLDYRGFALCSMHLIISAYFCPANWFPFCTARYGEKTILAIILDGGNEYDLQNWLNMTSQPQ